MGEFADDATERDLMLWLDELECTAEESDWGSDLFDDPISGQTIKRRMPMPNKDFSKVQGFTGFEKMDKPMELVKNGRTLQQMKTEYHTAVSVQKERDVAKVEQAVLRDAKYLAGQGYYFWMVKDKRARRKKPVQGPSIKLAISLAREWGNCAMPTYHDETPTHWLFSASFVDLERGFTMTREFRKRKPKSSGNYDIERMEEMEFQKAQSQAIRNVVVNGVPAWLTAKAMDTCMKTEIEKMGPLDKARESAVAWFEKKRVAQSMLLEHLGKLTVEEIDVTDVLILRSYVQQMKDGDAQLQELFPELGGRQGTPSQNGSPPPSAPPQELAREFQDRKRGKKKGEKPAEKPAETTGKAPFEVFHGEEGVLLPTDLSEALRGLNEAFHELIGEYPDLLTEQDSIRTWAREMVGCEDIFLVTAETVTVTDLELLTKDLQEGDESQLLHFIFAGEAIVPPQKEG